MTCGRPRTGRRTGCWTSWCTSASSCTCPPSTPTPSSSAAESGSGAGASGPVRSGRSALRGRAVRRHGRARRRARAPRGRGRQSGVRLERDTAHMWTIADGQVTRCACTWIAPRPRGAGPRGTSQAPIADSTCSRTPARPASGARRAPHQRERQACGGLNGGSPGGHRATPRPSAA